MATVKKRGKSYLLRVYAGYDATGKQIEKTKTWTPPVEWSEKRAEKEARHQAELFEEKIRNGEVANGNIKFSDFAELWFARYAECRLRPRTIARYRELLAVINPAIGHITLEKIRPAHLLEFYEALKDTEPKNAAYCCRIDLKKRLQKMGITKAAFSEQIKVSLTTLSTAFHKQGIKKSSALRICSGLEESLDNCFQPLEPEKTLSPATIKHYHHLLSDILGAAVKWQYITYNPCTRVEPPKAVPPKIEYLDDEQSKHLLELLKQEPGFYRRAATLLLLTGMRRGELLGLEWQDVDWNNKTVHIERTSQYLPKRGVFTDTTKNEASNRFLKISPLVIGVLQEQIFWQQLQRKRLGDKWIYSNRIITSEDGRPMHPDRLTRWFSKFIKKTDLPHIHLHGLRHTYATLCIANGAPITGVSAQLGHANVATTTTIYAHSIKSAEIAAANKIDKLFEGIL